MDQRYDGVGETQKTKAVFPENYEYEVFQKDKFVIRIPKSGFFFDEYGCWVYISGAKARIGVTDLTLQSLNEIIDFTPPTVGVAIKQFGELATIESGKAAFTLASPISGKVMSFNEALVKAPELIKQDPYEKGWIAEVELDDFEKDRELLLDFNGYLPVLKRRLAELS